MTIQSSNPESRDEYGFPLDFPPDVLNGMKERLNLSQETFQTIHDYFDAASNLYARIPLRMLYKIYNSQNPPVSQEDFLAAAEIISHERNHYSVLRPDVFHEDAGASQPMDQELVAEHLYAVDDEDYYILEQKQEGKPWYIPGREEFLKYTDSFYTEKSPQFLALADFLRSTQRKLHCPPLEVAEELADLFRMDIPLPNVVDDGQRLGVRFRYPQDFRTYLQLCLDLSQHTRRYSHRGHTPAELGLPQQSIEEAMKEVPFDTDCRDPFDKAGAALRTNIMGPATVTGKPAKNDPCPCGSGRKYKNCCGKGK